MRKLIILLCLIFPVSILKAQSLERSVLASSGNSGTAGSIAVDYTIGETIIATLASANTIVTAGFHQPNTTVSINETYTSALFRIYPNPSNDKVNVFLDSPGLKHGHIQIADVTGRVVYSSVVSDAQMKDSGLSISVSNFEAGVYFISVVLDKEDNSSEIYTSRLQVVH